MPTPFDQVIDRTGTHSTKWDRYKNQDVLPFWVADMDFATPDFVLSAIRQRLEHPVLGYTQLPASLDNAFCAWLQHHFNWQIDPDWLVWLPGVVPGLNLAARAARRSATSACLIPTPVYYPFLNVPANTDTVAQYVPLQQLSTQGPGGGRWVMNIDALQAACTPDTVALLLCNPQNPTGRCYSAAELQQIADFCEHNKLLLVSDEIHCNLVLAPGHRHLPIGKQCPGVAARTISLFAATKTFNMPGLGCAAAVIPDADLRRRFTEATAGLVPSLGPIAIAASTAAFNDRSPWLGELLDYLRSNVAALANVAGERMTPLEATYLAWLDVRDLDLAHPLNHFVRCGLGLSDGAQFAGPGFVRFNFGCPRATLDRGLERLANALAGR